MTHRRTRPAIKLMCSGCLHGCLREKSLRQPNTLLSIFRFEPTHHLPVFALRTPRTRFVATHPSFCSLFTTSKTTTTTTTKMMSASVARTLRSQATVVDAVKALTESLVQSSTTALLTYLMVHVVGEYGLPVFTFLYVQAYLRDIAKPDLSSKQSDSCYAVSLVLLLLFFFFGILTQPCYTRIAASLF